MPNLLIIIVITYQLTITNYIIQQYVINYVIQIYTSAWFQIYFSQQLESFIPYIFVEYLPYAKHCSRCWCTARWIVAYIVVEENIQQTNT